MSFTTLVLSLLAACSTVEEPCEANIAVWEDLDGDGFGGASLGKVCKVGKGQVEVAQDCDDNDPLLNDCDGKVDDDANLKQWWFDGDGDGYGGRYRSILSCDRPEGDWVANQADCDDTNPTVNPSATEVCGRVDEDCDGYIDEADDSVDPASYSVFYADKDGDGYGDRNDTIERCRLIPGYVLEGNDCNDTTPALTQREYWTDADGDGYGDPAAIVMGCAVAPHGTVDNDDDCDDTDPDILYQSDWYEDPDGDGYGSGPSLAFVCVQPYPDAVREGGDCNEALPEINPGANEICEDGIDQDCSGSDISCGPIGSYLVESGPSWVGDPPVLSCVEACAQIFGGDSDDYACSTLETDLNHRAFVSGWGDGSFCFGNGQTEDFKLEPAGNPGYNCGGFGCAYSAYVQDNCFGSRNWCWLQ